MLCIRSWRELMVDVNVKNEIATSGAILKRNGPSVSNRHRRLASISIDLDNQWSYMKTYGAQGWEKQPSYLDAFVPYVLDALERCDLKITFFVVGQDAALEKNTDVLKQICNSGHEFANHSFSHEPWLHLYRKDKVEREILETEEHIIRVTGQKPVGFRGPGFSSSKDILEVLLKNGYMYDATILPTYLGPLACAYYFRSKDLSLKERNDRKEILGFKEGMKTVKPYLWKLASGGELLEIPVTTVPVIKTPFHMSYLLFLGRFSEFIMLLYLKIALAMCMLTGTEPSFVIHPTDLLGGNQVPAMRFFPGMELSGDRKIQLFENVIGMLTTHFTFVNMSTHAKSILKRDNLKVVKP